MATRWLGAEGPRVPGDVLPGRELSCNRPMRGAESEGERPAELGIADRTLGLTDAVLRTTEALGSKRWGTPVRGREAGRSIARGVEGLLLGSCCASTLRELRNASTDGRRTVPGCDGPRDFVKPGTPVRTALDWRRCASLVEGGEEITVCVRV